MFWMLWYNFWILFYFPVGHRQYIEMQLNLHMILNLSALKTLFHKLRFSFPRSQLSFLSFPYMWIAIEPVMRCSKHTDHRNGMTQYMKNGQKMLLIADFRWWHHLRLALVKCVISFPSFRLPGAVSGDPSTAVIWVGKWASLRCQSWTLISAGS